MDRSYGLSAAQVSDLIADGGDFTVKVRGRTFDVFNASGKRKYGEIYQNRDNSWSMQMPGASPATSRLIDRLTKAAGPVPVPST
jgi:hypothetical protein